MCGINTRLLPVLVTNCDVLWIHEIIDKKLYGFNYYLQADGFSAYWSIPVCEESKRLTAFHTPDGIYCWNRLMMGAVPSSAVQQTAYLEALDQYIDYDENDNLRQCLLDRNGE